MSDPTCPFCRRLVFPDLIPADELVWAFPHSFVLLGPWQFYHGYCVVVSRTHARELGDLVDDERRAYLDEMCLVARAISQAFSPHKLNYELLGNQVPHLHWHLFARYADDPACLAPVWLAKWLADEKTIEYFTRSTRTTNARFRRDFGWAPRYTTYREGLDQIVAEWKSEASRDSAA